MIKTIDITIDQLEHYINLVSENGILNVEAMTISERIILKSLIDSYSRIRTAMCNGNDLLLSSSAVSSMLKIIPISTLTGKIAEYKDRSIYDLSYTTTE